jgi:hypothetical protein
LADPEQFLAINSCKNRTHLLVDDFYLGGAAVRMGQHLVQLLCFGSV